MGPEQAKHRRMAKKLEGTLGNTDMGGGGAEGEAAEQRGQGGGGGAEPDEQFLNLGDEQNLQGSGDQCDRKGPKSTKMAKSEAKKSGKKPKGIQKW